jgi:predicted site-specific integrase-resolvase
MDHERSPSGGLSVEKLLYDRFGMRLTMEQLAEALAISVHTLRNQISAGHIPVKTYRVQGRRFADFRDVAAYLDQCRAQAT